MGRELLSLKGVGYSYGGEERGKVLSDVSIDVGVAEVVAVVGESGCGKTTLGKVVVGLLRSQWGEVLFEGRNVASLSGRARRMWRRSVQVVQQDPYASLNPGLTIGKTLSGGLKCYHIVRRRDVEEEVFRLLELVGLEGTAEFTRRFPHQLSGGQRQRVAIARALSVQPKLIVADEVTSMLDVSMRVAILDLLLSIRDKLGVGCMFISHDLGVVRYVAREGRTVVMFFGSVVEVGPTEDVIRFPLHPYTWSLVEAVPVPDPVEARRRRGRQGALKLEGGASSGGCVFAMRCPFVVDRCRREVPMLSEVSPGRFVRCNRADIVAVHLRNERGKVQDDADVWKAGRAVGTGVARNVAFD